jgi:uncharacterized membrane protein YhhN
MPLWIAIAAPLLLIALLWTVQTDRWGLGVGIKTCLSALFVATALAQSGGIPFYGRAICIGLILSLGGDVALALKSKAAFRVGLVLFLLAHLAYTTAFLVTWSPGNWALGFTLGAAAGGAVLFHLLAPHLVGTHLGSFKRPVLAYIVAISCMLVGAAGILDHPYNMATRRLVLLGALFFYISDLFVARHRFVRAAFANRLVGLSLYYTGQFMLAVSIGYVTLPVG